MYKTDTRHLNIFINNSFVLLSQVNLKKVTCFVINNQNIFSFMKKFEKE